jgi:hypothetical protein
MTIMRWIQCYARARGCPAGSCRRGAKLIRFFSLLTGALRRTAKRQKFALENSNVRTYLRARGSASGMCEISCGAVRHRRLKCGTKEDMNRLWTICLLACLLPNMAMGQAALEHHVWQDKRSFEPMSSTCNVFSAVADTLEISDQSNGGNAFAQIEGYGLPS